MMENSMELKNKLGLKDWNSSTRKRESASKKPKDSMTSTFWILMKPEPMRDCRRFTGGCLKIYMILQGRPVN